MDLLSLLPSPLHEHPSYLQLLHLLWEATPPTLNLVCG